MVYQGIPLVNLADCEIRSVLFGLRGRVEEWNLMSGMTSPVLLVGSCPRGPDAGGAPSVRHGSRHGGCMFPLRRMSGPDRMDVALC
jgi:hypothetical protein